MCSCVPGYIGSPPSCRPECVTNNECPQNEACNNQKCRDPCPGTCGINAKCQVRNHNPICSCPQGYTGDPFVRCQVVVIQQAPPSDPCQPSPCGPNSQCRVVADQASCSCLPEMIGNPPYCKPECISNSECSSHLACINQKCKDPCPNACGSNAECKVVSHTPMCYCLSGYTGDPFGYCSEIRQDYPIEVSTPCSPSPCGSNAICREQNGAGACSCVSDYIGNPYEGCRPECVLNSDCASSLACINNKCKDPCPGTCGLNAICQVVNHLPSCTCISGYTGDPFRQCSFKQSERKISLHTFRPHIIQTILLLRSARTKVLKSRKNFGKFITVEIVFSIFFLCFRMLGEKKKNVCRSVRPAVRPAVCAVTLEPLIRFEKFFRQFLPTFNTKN